METSGFMKGLYGFSIWLIRFIATNVLWLLFSIPIVYLSLNILSVQTTDQFLVNFITIVISMPFILFPATTAMFGVVRQWIMGNTEIALLQTYWKCYKENYLRSLLGGLIIVPLMVILFIDYFYFTEANSPLRYIFYFIAVFMFVFIMHYFSNTVHLKLKFFTAIKNSFLLSIGNPVYTIGITASSALILYFSFSLYKALILLGTGVLVSYCAFFLYYKSQIQLMEQEHKE